TPNPDLHGLINWIYIDYFCVILLSGLSFHLIFSPQYLAYLGIQSLVQQGAIQGKTAHELMDHSLSELIDISLAQTTSIWMMYGKSNVNHNTLCHLAELHGCFTSIDVLKHLKGQFPPHTQHAKLLMLCDLKIQFDRAMNDGKYHLAEPHVTAIAAFNKTEAQVLKALNRTTKAYSILQRLQLYWLYIYTTGLYLKTPSIVCVVFCHPVQLVLGVLEQTLAVMDKGRALLLAARCQVATAGSQPSGLGMAMQTLVEDVAYFSMLDCKGRLWDVHYLQARLHHSLGQTPQCNKYAMLFHLLDQELQAPRAAVAMRL
uniref:Uncharacterized protein n=1 Tax=Salmo trutta TaxID=8032 RepID=A0A674D2I7_SALTR